MKRCINRSPGSVSLIALVIATMIASPAMAQDGSQSPDEQAPDAEAEVAASGDVVPATGDEAIVVTGSRLRTGFQTPTPVTVLGADLIESRAPANILEVVNELPQFRNTTSQTGGTRGNVGPAGTNVLDLRGLGANRTLVLVDGRRLPPTRDGASPDTNSIPSLLVERIEVVTGGASAAYGSGAISGVAQFILRRNFEGFQATVQSGISERGDNQSFFGSAAWGGRIGERVQIMVGGEYVHDRGVGSSLTREWGRREVGLLSLPAGRAAGLPAQLFADGVRFNSQSPGGVVTSGPLRGLTFLPNGQTGIFDFGTLTGGNQMTGSTSNFGTSLNAYQTLKIPITRGVVLGRATVDLGNSTEAWVELGYNFLRARGVSGFNYARENNIIIRVDNPFLPTSVRDQMVANNLTTINIGRSNMEWGPAKGRSETDEYRSAAGLRGSFGGGWGWDAFLQYDRVKYLYRSVDQVLVPNYNAAIFAVDDGNGNIVCGDLASNPNLTAAQRAQVQPGCVPFNPFGFNSPSQNAIDYVTANEELPNITQLYAGGFGVTGNLLELPAGSVAVAFGIEARRESTRVTQSPFAGLFNLGNLRAYSGAFSVVEGYAEATVPLLRERPFFHRLELNGAVRYADYSSFGGSTSWKLGAIWEPVNGVRFRATRSRDLRAPTLGDLFKPGFITNAQLRNPVTGVTALVQQLSANNPDLGPEVADTWTAGVVLTPRWPWASGLSISADYYDISIDDVITTVGGQQTINLCFLDNVQEFCDSIDLDPANPTGFGLVRATSYNAASQRARGVDVELAYQTSLDRIGAPGRLNFSAVGSYVDTLITNNPGQPSQDSLFFTVPQWRWNVRAQYRNDAFSAYLQMNAVSSTRYSQNVIGPEDPGYDPTLSQSISSNRFPAYQYFNAGATFYFGSDRQYQFYLNVDNLFDRDPPGNVFFNGANVYDVIGRSYRAGFRVRI